MQQIRDRIRRRLRLLGACAVLAAGVVVVGAGVPVAAAATATPTVSLTEVSGPITPVIRDHLADTVATAANRGDAALVIRLNTPGGGLDVTREIANVLLDAPLPVIVYVAPSGADAGSAGTFITYAAHLAAMAPATTIGAATPVDLEGGEVGGKIVENTVAFGLALAEARNRDADFITNAIREGRSVTASEALAAGAVDLIATTTDELLVAVDGMVVDVLGEPVTLSTASATIVEMEMTGTRNLLQILANPNLAFIFLSLGTLAILYEISNPGLGLGGVAGVVMLILALFSLAVLPVNYAGAALLVVAVAMFIAELFAPGVGVGAAGGTAALILGGLFLFQSQTGVGVDLWVLLPTAVVTFGLVVLAGLMVARARGRTSRAASDYLVGRHVTVLSAEGTSGRARVDGVSWKIRSQDHRPLHVGEVVEIVARDNIELHVESTASGAQPAADSTSPSAGTDVAHAHASHDAVHEPPGASPDRSEHPTRE